MRAQKVMISLLLKNMKKDSVVSLFKIQNFYKHCLFGAMPATFIYSYLFLRTNL